ncbi:S41 family peptidase, partial [bacterium]|nr:S41 family peptidase [bacterium]
EFTMPGVVYPIDDLHNQDQIGDVQKACSFPHLEWCTNKDVAYRLKVKPIVLIGQSTFSCGELFAKAIEEMNIGTTMGTTTAGKLVLARDDFDLGYGYNASIPFASVLTRDRYKIEGKGVKPMLELDFDSSIELELSHDQILELI